MTIDECASQLLHEAGKVGPLGIKVYNWWNEALHGAARSGIATVIIPFKNMRIMAYTKVGPSGLPM